MLLLLLLLLLCERTYLSLSFSFPRRRKCPSALRTLFLKLLARCARRRTCVTGPLVLTLISLSKFSDSSTSMNASGASAWPARTRSDRFIRIVPDSLLRACADTTLDICIPRTSLVCLHRDIAPARLSGRLGPRAIRTVCKVLREAQVGEAKRECAPRKPFRRPVPSPVQEVTTTSCMTSCLLQNMNW